MEKLIDRAGAIYSIKTVIEQDDAGDLQALCRYAAEAPGLDMANTLKLWHEARELTECSDSELICLLRFCIARYPQLGCEADYVAGAGAGIKEAFLQSIENETTRRIAAGILKNLNRHIESIFEKDLARLTLDEAVAGMANMELISRASIRQVLSLARKYVKWRRSAEAFPEGVTDAFMRIRVEDIPLKKAARKRLVATPEELVARLEKHVPLDGGYLSPPVLCLGWMGLCLDEMLALGDGDVDLNRKEITLGGGRRAIPQAFLPVFQRYLAVDEVTRETGCVAVVRKRYDSGRFLRKMLSPNEAPRLLGKSDLLAGVAGTGMKIGDVELSGHLYRLYLRSLEQGTLENQAFAEEFHLDPHSTGAGSALADKKAMYEAYRQAFWTVGTR